MRGEKRKSSKKTKQDVNINWILGSQEPTPIAFFRLTHPTARTRAFEKYRKCFNLALDRSEGDKLDRLRAVNNDEETLQRDWETWLKEKKAVCLFHVFLSYSFVVSKIQIYPLDSSLSTNHDTGLLIQQDFTSTITNIVGIVGAKSDDNKENDFDIEEHSNRKHQLEEVDVEELNNEILVASVPPVTKKARSEDNDVDEEHEAIYIRAVHLAHKETTSEIKDIFEKIESLKDRILQYRIINLSVRSVTNPLHKVLSEDEKNLLKDIWISLEPSEDDKINTARYKKWERFLMIFMAPINQLLDPEQTEFSYRENFINPIFTKVFDDLMELIHMRTGEIENMLIKTQRIETRARTQFWQTLSSI
ncbi:hypothetical protein GLOIN_2v1768430 [Rhizophagus clarus]|uniref:Uncharacterized protein n=1 Tax=Rhizophagus clarus TaxID=94130 RepID=A0A8H3LC49_9GLOM|nr:hypothetical protein GLOIN_2v1768430 [Rhizophagus clarus]